MQLVCPAGNLPALQAAVDAGANAVYVGFRDQTNARAFPGLNFSDADLREGIDFAHKNHCKVYVALNTYPDSARIGEYDLTSPSIGFHISVFVASSIEKYFLILRPTNLMFGCAACFGSALA